MKAQERVVNFEQISDLFLVFLLLTLNTFFAGLTQIC